MYQNYCMGVILLKSFTSLNISDRDIFLSKTDQLMSNTHSRGLDALSYFPRDSTAINNVCTKIR